MGCFDNIPLESIENCVMEELAAGISELEVYACVAPHIEADAVLPALGVVGGTLESIAKLTGDITFPAAGGFGFFKLQLQADSGEIKDTIVGNKGNKKAKTEFSFYIPNTHAKNIGYVRQYKNAPMVFIVTEKSGRKRRIGSKSIPAYMNSVEMTTGKGQEDDTGLQVTVDMVSSSPAPIYEGAITEAGA